MKTPVKKLFLAGLMGGTIATLILFVGTSLLGLPFPPLAIFQLLIAPVPGSIQSVVVESLQEYAKYSAFVFSSVIYVVIYGIIAIFIGRAFKGEVQRNSNKTTLIGTIVPTLIALGLQLELTSAFSALSSWFGWLAAILLALAANIIYSRTVISSVRVPIAESMKAPQQSVYSPRRSFIRKAVIAAIVLAAAGIAARLGLSLLTGQPVVTNSNSVPINPSPESTGSNIPPIFNDPKISDLLGSEVTDNRVFYRVDIDPIPPQVDLNNWTLKIHGEVNNPLTLDKDSLNNFPTMDEYVTLECVSNTINPPGSLISNAKWTGVSLASLLGQAGVRADGKYAVFRCADGYTVGIPLERAMLPDALLAYRMNDQTLPDEHGFPLRAIVPGIYGMMNAKWITEIEIVNQVYLGYWQERGWSNDARIKTTSILYYPQPGADITGSTPIAGVAFAGDRGISKVEVSVDGGSTWNGAVLKEPKSPYSWVLWAYAWNPINKGAATIVARAYDGTGARQDQTVNDPFPNGASGYQSIQVTVS
jgi:DMSO/TMAO reductase YedYZ molybdopterin-dependent catalytic subunit